MLEHPQAISPVRKVTESTPTRRQVDVIETLLVRSNRAEYLF